MSHFVLASAVSKYPGCSVDNSLHFVLSSDAGAEFRLGEDGD